MDVMMLKEVGKKELLTIKSGDGNDNTDGDFSQA